MSWYWLAKFFTIFGSVIPDRWFFFKDEAKRWFKMPIRAIGRSEYPGVPVLFGRHNLPFTRLSWQTLAPPGTTRLPIPSTYFSKYLKLKDITFSHLKKRKCYEWPTWCPRVCCRPILYFFLFVVSSQVSLCCSAYLHYGWGLTFHWVWEQKVLCCCAGAKVEKI